MAKDDPTTRPGHDPRRDLLERDDYLRNAEDERVGRELERKLRAATRRPSQGPAAGGAGRRWDR